jgi:ABC-type iron transport system FetAB permease component
VVKNRARDLLRAVADGGDVSTARIHDFASAVIQAPAFQLAQEILHEESPEFTARKAIELASMVLGAHHRAAQDLEGCIGIRRPAIRAK